MQKFHTALTNGDFTKQVFAGKKYDHWFTFAQTELHAKAAAWRARKASQLIEPCAAAIAKGLQGGSITGSLTEIEFDPKQKQGPLPGDVFSGGNSQCGL